MPTTDEDPPLAPGVVTVAEDSLANEDIPLVTGVVRKEVSMLPVILVVRDCIIRQNTTESRRASI